jgi:hypothetical protein
MTGIGDCFHNGVNFLGLPDKLCKFEDDIKIGAQKINK